MAPREVRLGPWEANADHALPGPTPRPKALPELDAGVEGAAQVSPSVSPLAWNSECLGAEQRGPAREERERRAWKVDRQCRPRSKRNKRRHSLQSERPKYA